MSSSPAADALERSVLDKIGADMASLYRRWYGKGPESTRTYLDRNLLVCALNGNLTTLESTLSGAGHTEVVSNARRLFQETVRDELIDIVESRTGRRVESFASAWDPDALYDYELFLLGPARESASDDDADD